MESSAHHNVVCDFVKAQSECGDEGWSAYRDVLLSSEVQGLILARLQAGSAAVSAVSKKRSASAPGAADDGAGAADDGAGAADDGAGAKVSNTGPVGEDPTCDIKVKVCQMDGTTIVVDVAFNATIRDVKESIKGQQAHTRLHAIQLHASDVEDPLADALSVRNIFVPTTDTVLLERWVATAERTQLSELLIERFGSTWDQDLGQLLTWESAVLQQGAAAMQAEEDHAQVYQFIVSCVDERVVMLAQQNARHGASADRGNVLFMLLNEPNLETAKQLNEDMAELLKHQDSQIAALKQTHMPEIDRQAALISDCFEAMRSSEAERSKSDGRSCYICQWRVGHPTNCLVRQHAEAYAYGTDPDCGKPSDLQECAGRCGLLLCLACRPVLCRWCKLFAADSEPLEAEEAGGYCEACWPAHFKDTSGKCGCPGCTGDKQYSTHCRDDCCANCAEDEDLHNE
jgi:hypothetical protein